MKAIVWQGPEEMTIEERPDPRDPEAGELIVRPQAVGICGSEVEGYLGHMDNRTPPLVMGHEFAGLVVAAGADARDFEGTRVAVNPLSGCGHCRLCDAGHSNLCRDRVLIGVHAPGAFADYVRAPAASARALPDDVSARTGALVEPLSNGVHAVRLGLAHATVERAVVLGAGTIGLVTLQAALLAGIEHVAVLEPQPQRRELAATLGAHATYGIGGGGSSRPSARPPTGSAPTSCSTRSARRRRGASRCGCCGRPARWCMSASRPTTRRSASTMWCAAS